MLGRFMFIARATVDQKMLNRISMPAISVMLILTLFANMVLTSHSSMSLYAALKTRAYPDPDRCRTHGLTAYRCIEQGQTFYSDHKDSV